MEGQDSLQFKLYSILKNGKNIKNEKNKTKRNFGLNTFEIPISTEMVQLIDSTFDSLDGEGLLDSKVGSRLSLPLSTESLFFPTSSLLTSATTSYKPLLNNHSEIRSESASFDISKNQYQKITINESEDIDKYNSRLKVLWWQRKALLESKSGNYQDASNTIQNAINEHLGIFNGDYEKANLSQKALSSDPVELLASINEQFFLYDPLAHRLANKIQKLARFYLRKKNNFATQISKVFRGYLARKKVNEYRLLRKQCAILIQKRFRRHLQKMHNLATRIKQWFKLRKDVKKYQAMLILYKAARSIQRIMRGFLARRKFEIFLKLHNSSVIIQRNIRQYFVKRERYYIISRYHKLIYLSIRKIQKFIRKYQAIKRIRLKLYLEILCENIRSEKEKNYINDLLRLKLIQYNFYLKDPFINRLYFDYYQKKKQFRDDVMKTNFLMLQVNDKNSKIESKSKKKGKSEKSKKSEKKSDSFEKEASLKKSNSSKKKKKKSSEKINEKENSNIKESTTSLLVDTSTNNLHSLSFINPYIIQLLENYDEFFDGKINIQCLVKILDLIIQNGKQSIFRKNQTYLIFHLRNVLDPDNLGYFYIGDFLDWFDSENADNFLPYIDFLGEKNQKSASTLLIKDDSNILQQKNIKYYFFQNFYNHFSFFSSPLKLSRTKNISNDLGSGDNSTLQSVNPLLPINILYIKKEVINKNWYNFHRANYRKKFNKPKFQCCQCLSQFTFFTDFSFHFNDKQSCPINGLQGYFFHDSYHLKDNWSLQRQIEDEIIRWNLEIKFVRYNIQKALLEEILIIKNSQIVQKQIYHSTNKLSEFIKTNYFSRIKNWNPKELKSVIIKTLLKYISLDGKKKMFSEFILIILSSNLRLKFLKEWYLDESIEISKIEKWLKECFNINYDIGKTEKNFQEKEKSSSKKVNDSYSDNAVNKSVSSNFSWNHKYSDSVNFPTSEISEGLFCFEYTLYINKNHQFLNPSNNLISPKVNIFKKKKEIFVEFYSRLLAEIIIICFLILKKESLTSILSILDFRGEMPRMIEIDDNILISLGLDNITKKEYDSKFEQLTLEQMNIEKFFSFVENLNNPTKIPINILSFFKKSILISPNTDTEQILNPFSFDYNHKNSFEKCIMKEKSKFIREVNPLRKKIFQELNNEFSTLRYTMKESQSLTYNTKNNPESVFSEYFFKWKKLVEPIISKNPSKSMGELLFNLFFIFLKYLYLFEKFNLSICDLPDSSIIVDNSYLVFISEEIQTYLPTLDLISMKDDLCLKNNSYFSFNDLLKKISQFIEQSKSVDTFDQFTCLFNILSRPSNLISTDFVKIIDSLTCDIQISLIDNCFSVSSDSDYDSIWNAVRLSDNMGFNSNMHTISKIALSLTDHKDISKSIFINFSKLRKLRDIEEQSYFNNILQYLQDKQSKHINRMLKFTILGKNRIKYEERLIKIFHSSIKRSYFSIISDMNNDELIDLLEKNNINETESNLFLSFYIDLYLRIFDTNCAGMLDQWEELRIKKYFKTDSFTKSPSVNLFRNYFSIIKNNKDHNICSIIDKNSNHKLIGSISKDISPKISFLLPSSGILHNFPFLNTASKSIEIKSMPSKYYAFTVILSIERRIILQQTEKHLKQSSNLTFEGFNNNKLIHEIFPIEIPISKNYQKIDGKNKEISKSLLIRSQILVMRQVESFLNLPLGNFFWLSTRNLIVHKLWIEVFGECSQVNTLTQLNNPFSIDKIFEYSFQLFALDNNCILNIELINLIHYLKSTWKIIFFKSSWVEFFNTLNSSYSRDSIRYLSYSETVSFLKSHVNFSSPLVFNLTRNQIQHSISSDSQTKIFSKARQEAILISMRMKNIVVTDTNYRCSILGLYTMKDIVNINTNEIISKEEPSSFIYRELVPLYLLEMGLSPDEFFNNYLQEFLPLLHPDGTILLDEILRINLQNVIENDILKTSTYFRSIKRFKWRLLKKSFYSLERFKLSNIIKNYSRQYQIIGSRFLQELISGISYYPFEQ